MFHQYALNKIHDALFRGQPLGAPGTWYVGIFSTLPVSRSSAGTEISTGAGYTGYARKPIVASLAAISGTQGDGTTAASSGTNEYGSNNAAISYIASLAAAWPGLVGVGWYDALTAGNLWVSGPITNIAGTAITRSFAIGDPVAFDPATLRGGPWS